ncbi:hypothetical protein K474DRAFT_1709675 [Panus rudis PR-1116 ss-1]|nr:hypothetical protein K474DRAFT_1709675 [Panus rudis PR-1116 ss-1]
MSNNTGRKTLASFCDFFEDDSFSRCRHLKYLDIETREGHAKETHRSMEMLIMARLPNYIDSPIAIELLTSINEIPRAMGSLSRLRRIDICGEPSHPSFLTEAIRFVKFITSPLLSVCLDSGIYRKQASSSDSVLLDMLKHLSPSLECPDVASFKCDSRMVQFAKLKTLMVEHPLEQGINILILISPLYSFASESVTWRSLRSVVQPVPIGPLPVQCDVDEGNFEA